MLFVLGIVDILIIILAIIIIALVAMQNSKDDLGSALTGAASSELFKKQKERGVEVYIVRATYICSVIFMALVILALVG